MKRLLTVLASGGTVIMLFTYAGAYLVSSLGGWFAPGDVSWRQAVYAGPVLYAGWALLPWVLLRGVVFPGGGRRLVRVLMVLGALLMGLGLSTGALTHFEGRVVLTEGQKFSGFRGEYREGTLSLGSRGRFPTITLEMLEVRPGFSEDGGSVLSLAARVRAAGREGQGDTKEILVSERPTRVGDVRVRLRDFGYAPPFVVRDDKGQILDRAIVALNLFPPGSEDSFRILLPHTFTVSFTGVKAEPAGGNAGDQSAGEVRGIYHLRIARNKELLVSRPVEPGEAVGFDTGTITLETPRRWVELCLVRDYGMPVLALGGLVFLIGLAGETRVRRRGAGSVP